MRALILMILGVKRHCCWESNEYFVPALRLLPGSISHAYTVWNEYSRH